MFATSYIQCRFTNAETGKAVADALLDVELWPPDFEPFNLLLSQRGIEPLVDTKEYPDSVWVQQIDSNTVRLMVSGEQAGQVVGLRAAFIEAFLELGIELLYELSDDEEGEPEFTSRNQAGQVMTYIACNADPRQGAYDEHVLRALYESDSGWGALERCLEIEEFRDPSKRPDDSVEVLGPDAPFEHIPKTGRTAVRVSVLRDRWFRGLVDATGRVVAEPAYLEALPFSEGLAALKGEAGFEYVDRAGKKAFEGEFEYAGCFSRGMAAVMARNERGRLRSFLIDRKGNEKLDIGTDKSFHLYRDYLDAAELRIYQPSLHDGLIPFSVEESMGYMDASGNIVIEPRFLMCDNFREGIGCVEFGSKKAALDTGGRTIVEGEFDLLSGAQGGIIIGHTEGRFNRYFSKTGRLLFELPHPGVGDFGEFHERMAVVVLPDPYHGGFGMGLVHEIGEMILEPVFHSISAFSDGVAVACYQGTWGLLNVDLVFRRFPDDVQDKGYEYEVTNVPGVLRVYADDRKRQGIADLEGRVIYLPE